MICSKALLTGKDNGHHLSAIMTVNSMSGLQPMARPDVGLSILRQIRPVPGNFFRAPRISMTVRFCLMMTGGCISFTVRDSLRSWNLIWPMYFPVASISKYLNGMLTNKGCWKVVPSSSIMGNITCWWFLWIGVFPAVCVVKYAIVPIRLPDLTKSVSFLKRSLTGMAVLVKDVS